MQGERIGEESGKVTSQRVLPNPGGAPKMETTFQASGTILGAKHRTTGTYQSILRPDGTLYGEGQGVVMGGEGDLATWIGQGIGILNQDGSTSYRGALYYQTTSARWSRLNRVAAVFEYEIDAEGSTSAELWEWK